MSDNYRISKEKLIFDSRPIGDKVKEVFFQPKPYITFIAIIIFIGLLFPFFAPFLAFIILVSRLIRKEKLPRSPLRMPKGLNALDPSDKREVLIEKNGIFGKKTITQKRLGEANGILFLGNLRSRNPYENGQEIWLTNDDARTHMFLAGTTGSGKTETNLGLYTNALCWGAGTSYGDGKGQVSLPFAMWSLARRFGREDDFLLLNFLTGGEDSLTKFSSENIEDEEQIRLPQSNTQNPYAYGSVDFLFNLTASLLPKATGDSASWQEKALNLLSALTIIFCYKRSKGNFEISIGKYRHYMVLDNLTELYKEAQEPDAPELAYAPLLHYFRSALPGFNPALIDEPDKWEPEVRIQHTYLTGQFSRLLSLMMDTYGYIFDTQHPDVDPEDVLLNNRILCMLIPSLEKSPSEAAALGKLNINGVRLMMAKNLGATFEGSAEDILDVNQTKSPYPSIIIWDEIAYYFAEGIAVMYAQARSLGFMMVASVQDVQKLLDSGDKGEIGALIGNSKVKWSLALEDAKETFEIFDKAADEGYYNVIGGYEKNIGTLSNSWREQKNSRIEKIRNIDVSELKNADPGEGVVIFKDRVVRVKSFYIPDHEKEARKIKARINRFLEIETPKTTNIPEGVLLPKNYIQESKNIKSCVENGVLPSYDIVNDPILERLKLVSLHLKNLEEIGVETDPSMIGPVLFEAASEVIYEAEKHGTEWMPSTPDFGLDNLEEDEL